MKKRKWVLGIITAAVCVTALVANPSQTKAASQSDITAYRAEFDAEYYYQTYPDVAAAVGHNAQALLNHYVTFGIREGRNGNAGFNVQAYRARYHDLQEVFGDDLAAYCRHFESYGRAEGRNASEDGHTAAAPAARQSAEKASVVPAENRTKVQSAERTVLASRSTRYDAGIPRANNVELAAQRISGTVLQPGERFSFSRKILPRTSANGYVEAPIFVKGEISKGIGGGVCQVSSTLYAAMLDAGLPATERHPHSRQVDYLPEGYDAAIAGNRLDLKFVNIYSQPLCIEASASNGTVTITLVLQ